jgi:hypothetical protein
LSFFLQSPDLKPSPTTNAAPEFLIQSVIESLDDAKAFGTAAAIMATATNTPTSIEARFFILIYL